MLINSPRHSVEDLRRWRRVEETALVHGRLSSYRKHVQRSRAALLSFTGIHDCYAGVSWGKDSVALAHLVMSLAPRVVLVWIRIEPIKNPDCALVRDEFLRLFPRTRYEEIESRCTHDCAGWHATGTLERGFSEASKRHGSRYVSGIRAEESGQRERRMRAFGESSASTCAPIGWWSSWDLWAYTLEHGLPIHPAYACTMDGLLDPSRIRVASLGGKRGDGMGRTEWERRYYREELAALEHNVDL